MRTGFRLAIVPTVSILIVCGLAWILGNASYSPSMSSEWHTPEWVHVSQTGSTTRVRPIDMPNVDRRRGVDAQWVAERVSGWPFPCLAFRVVDDGETRIRGGIAVGKGDLILGPPSHLWRFPGLGRFVLPLEPVWLPFIASTVVIVVIIRLSIEALRLVQRALLQRVRRARALANVCPECGFPSAGSLQRCMECGAEGPEAEVVKSRCGSHGDAAAMGLRRRRVNIGLLVLLLVTVVACVDWRGCARRLHTPRGTAAAAPSTESPQSSNVAAPIMIELAGMDIDAASMRARLRVRITAPTDSDITVWRRDVELWAEQMEIRADSTAVVTQRLDQSMEADSTGTGTDDWHVSAGATLIIVYEIRNRAFRVDKSGVAYVHMPSSTIRYLKLRDNSQRQVQIEDLQTLEIR